MYIGRLEAGEEFAIRVSMAEGKQFSGTCFVASMDETLLKKTMQTLAQGDTQSL